VQDSDLISELQNFIRLYGDKPVRAGCLFKRPQDSDSEYEPKEIEILEIERHGYQYFALETGIKISMDRSKNTGRIEMPKRFS
jgi:hypothetical protein